MKSIVYVSAALMPLTHEALEGLLVEASGLNLASGVTGVLLCNDYTFMQCFEGADESVNVTWDRIKASRRHGSIIELRNETVAHCSFTGWEMGFRRASTSTLLALSTARWQAMSLNGLPGKSEGFEMLKTFWASA